MIGEQIYVAVAKGGIADFHSLIIPIEHFTCKDKLPESVLNEIKGAKEMMRRVFGKRGEGFISFELFYSLSYHVNIPIIPIKMEDEQELLMFFLERAKKLNIEQVDTIKDGYYLAIETHSGKRLVFSITGNFDISFGRTTVALFYKKQDKIDWKKCIQSFEEESKIAIELRKLLQQVE
jgi:hypothetical protein